MDALFSIPILSLFLVPALSSYTTSLNLIFFYMTWMTLVLSHPPLRVELFSTAAIRITFYVLPSLLFFLFDILTPSASLVVKAQGESGLPGGKKQGRIRAKELKVAGWALLNVVLGIGAQAMIESLLIQGLAMRSAVKVSMKLPMPWEMVKDLLRGLLGREVRIIDFKRLEDSLMTDWNRPNLDFNLHLASVHSPFQDNVSCEIPPILVPWPQGSVSTYRTL